MGYDANKAICFDLDDTVFFKFCSMYENRKIIEELISFSEKGYEVVVNSARSLEKMFQLLPILEDVCSKIVLIADSGQEIVSHGSKDLEWASYLEAIPKINQNAVEVVTNILERNSIAFHLTNHINDVYANIKVNTPVPLKIELDVNEALYYTGFFVKSGYDSIKIVSVLVNKGTAYMWWKQHYGRIIFDIGLGNGVLDKLFINCCRCKYLINYKGNRDSKKYLYRDICNYKEFKMFIGDLTANYR